MQTAGALQASIFGFSTFEIFLAAFLRFLNNFFRCGLSADELLESFEVSSSLSLKQASPSQQSSQHQAWLLPSGPCGGWGGTRELRVLRTFRFPQNL